MKEENTYKRRQGMSIVFSVILHLVLLVLVIAASAMPVKEKEKILKMRLASVKKPEPPPIQEVKQPDKPKPEVKPEPPKPEPPKPEPPKPEPPKPEPPKQVAKPEQPKPPPKPEVKPLPNPKPVVKNPPKEPPKQPEKPKQEAPKPKSLAERLAEGRKQTQQPVQQATRKSGKEIEKRLRESLNKPQTTSTPSNSVSAEMAAIEVETRSYAEEVVRPYIQRNWREPSKGELDVRNPTSVEVSFTVYASGNIANARIVKQSNSRVLNNSVQEFLRNMTRLSPLSAIGSKSSSLTIIVTMSITN